MKPTNEKRWYGLGRGHIDYPKRAAIKYGYLILKMTLREIGDELSISNTAVRHHLMAMGIKRRSNCPRTLKLRSREANGRLMVERHS